MRRRLATVRSDERGVVLIVVMAMLLVLGIISASVLATSIIGSRTTSKDRHVRGALGAALTGLDAAIYRLNVTIPADDSCPTLTDGSAALVSNGICGPYTSDTGSSATTQPLAGQSYRYWITQVMLTAHNAGGLTQDICTGQPPGGSVRPNLVIQERCITAEGKLLDSSGNVTATRRVQARVSSSLPFFPIPGVFGTSCLTLNPQNNNIAGDTACETTTGGPGSSAYLGAIGSNGIIRASIGSWGNEPTTGATNPAQLYLGNTNPTSGVPQTNYSFKFGSQTGINWTNGTGRMTFDDGTGSGNTATYQCPANATGPWTYPCLPWGPFNSTADSNVPQFFDSYFPLPKMNVIFSLPMPILRPTSTPTTNPVCPSTTSCDVAIYNNNSYLNTPFTGPGSGLASYGVTGSATNCAGTPYTNTAAAPRVLAIADNCTLRIPSGTYDFCSISIGSGSKILPADASPTAEVRVFLDNSNRAPAAGGVPCSASQANVGKLIVNGTGSATGAWMTNGTDCASIANDTWSAIGGQLYIYGAGDSGDATNVVAPSTNHAVDIPTLNQSMLYHGLLEAPNSTINIQHSGTCINGGVAAGAMNIAQNLGFTWDSTADLITGKSTRTYYKTAYSTCATAMPTVAAVQQPMDGC
jgi:Tfp pilus assembly protein PilX